MHCSNSNRKPKKRNKNKSERTHYFIFSGFSRPHNKSLRYPSEENRLFPFFFFHISSAKNILRINRVGPLLPRLSSQLHTPPTAPGALGYREEPRPRTTCPSTAPHMGHCCSCHRLRSSLLKLLPSKLPSLPQHTGVLS